jgi:hypothetical protein
MEAGKNSVIYMGLISGPNQADDTCGRTMDRGFTVLAISLMLHIKYNAFIIIQNYSHRKLIVDMRV